MKPYKITVNIEYDANLKEYAAITPKGTFHLCKDEYEELIGKEVVGEVDFILRKIKGNAADYINPFKFSEIYYEDESLLVHYYNRWHYQKDVRLLNRAIDTKALLKWAGRRMFSIEVEYYKE